MNRNSKPICGRLRNCVLVSIAAVLFVPVLESAAYRTIAKNPKQSSPKPGAPASTVEGCPVCCCDVTHPADASRSQALGYCLRSNRTDCKTMCEAALRKKVAGMAVQEVERILSSRVPGIIFEGDNITITETALRRILVYIYERDVMLHPTL